MTAGVGAWRRPQWYEQGMPAETDPAQLQRVRYAVTAIQRELIRRGYLVADPAKLDGGFGPKTTAAVKAFQHDAVLLTDGSVGPKTARRLWLPEFIWWQAALRIPSNFLWGLAGLESGFDPGAEGTVDADDRGLFEINRRYHPEVSDAVAFGDVGWCVAWAGNAMRAAYDSLHSWDAAIAYWNNPAAARQWVALGHAPNDRIAEYVLLVRHQAGMPA